MQHKVTDLHYVRQNYNDVCPEATDEEPYDGHDEGDFTYPRRLDIVWAGIPVPATCPISEDYANDPCRGPLCAHFRAFGQAAYIAKTTKALQEHKAKTDAMLQRLSEIGSALPSLPIFEEEDEELKPESRFDSIDMLGMLQLRALIEKAIPKLLVALDRYGRLKYEVCPICKALAPMDALIAADDFAREASKHSPAKSPGIIYPPGWNLGQTACGYHDGKSRIVNAVITAACRHTRQPICLVGTEAILYDTESVLDIFAKIESRLERHYEDALTVLDDEDDPSVSPFGEALKIVQAIQEMLYEYAGKIRKCPYPGCGEPLLSSAGKILLESTPATKAFQARVDGSSPRTVRLREPEYICIDDEDEDEIGQHGVKRKQAPESGKKQFAARSTKRTKTN